MNRKKFLKTVVATTALSMFNPSELADLLIPEKQLTLPFIDGEQKVTFLKPNYNLLSEVKAQYQTSYNYHYNYSYGTMAPYQQWYAYQQAMAYWNQQINYWIQYHNWLQQAHLQRMEMMLRSYRNAQIGQPSVWSAVRSIYAFAKSYNSELELFGLNRSGRSVKIKDTLTGAAKVYNTVSTYVGKNEAEKTTGPQSSESNAAIMLPDSSIKYGKKYDTQNGFLAVSDPDELVRAENGKIGRLAKYVTKGSKQYEVV